MEPLTLPDPTW